MDSTPDGSDELDVAGLQELVANATSQMASIELQIANETSTGEVEGQVVLIPDTTTSAVSTTSPTTTTLSPYASDRMSIRNLTELPVRSNVVWPKLFCYKTLSCQRVVYRYQHM
ncbi:hypothetical protein EB796_008081 [Bugula neritina]|uniref:Uncharacterized protein n=1 Tax=Bugula neritina TaxID=10212 RepID=A0A7J7K5X5_BUGNE|nr:hypothetical protein EB796_008081 [Bugula neritina]